jgi:pyruvate,water dikinase
MAVMIQEMVSPVLSGVILTRNPVTYASEIIIEAVEGSGDLLMQKGMNAMRWVLKDGTILEEAPSSKKYAVLVKQLASDAARIKKTHNADVDVEWVFDGDQVYYVQARPISSLSSLKIYSNRISRDMLPGMIKPLVWSVNIPLVNSVWIGILESIVGPLDIQPEDLAHAFFYRTYFNMGIFGEIFKSLGMPPDSMETMMGLKNEQKEKSSMRPGKEIIIHFPRILRFGLKHLSIGRKIAKDLGKIEETLDEVDLTAIKEKSAEVIFEEIEAQKGIVKKIAYYNIVAPLLMGFHNRMLKHHLERVGMDFLEFDLMKDIPTHVEYDPNHFIEALHRQYKSLPEEIQKRLLEKPETMLKGDTNIEEFKGDLSNFIHKFGHFSDSGNDFSYSPWRENLRLIMGMIANYEQVDESEQKASITDINTGFIRKQLIKRVYKQARKFRLLRDRVSSSYIFGYGIFRYYFLTLGNRMVEKKMLETNEDIFFLDERQVRDAFDSKIPIKKIKEVVSYHKKKMRSQEKIIPPELIYGENEPILNIESSREFHGIPASAGFYSGTACVVRSTDEFGKVKKGDVLVIPFSDVGWTPLFPKAGAVVSESGGMLSHCAIVAREYGIPSIVSALGVMNIEDGQRISIDANAGIVYLD